MLSQDYLYFGGRLSTEKLVICKERTCKHGQGHPLSCPYNVSSPYEDDDSVGSRVFIMWLSDFVHLRKWRHFFFKIKINFKNCTQFFQIKTWRDTQMEQLVVVQLAIDKGSVLGSSRPKSISCCLQNYISQVVCCMNRDSVGASFHSCSKRQVLYTSEMALACDLVSFWHEFDLRIKLALDSSSQWKLYGLPSPLS